ncbi:unnamed protein product, partial [Effrenium voratum]
MPLHNDVCTSSPALARGAARSESLMSICGLVRLELFLPAPAPANAEAALPPRGLAHVGLALLAPALPSPGLPSPLRSASQPGLLPPSWGCGQADPSLLASDYAHPSPSLPPRAFSCAGSTLSVLGGARSGQLSVLGCAHSEPILSLRSFARLGPVLLASDHGQPGASPLMRGLAHSGASSSVFGQVHFTYTNTYITSEVSSTNQLQFYV